jgi:hypothetical protein
MTGTPTPVAGRSPGPRASGAAARGYLPRFGGSRTRDRRQGPRGARSGAGVAAAGAAACAACCAGPIVGALGAIGLATAVGYLVAGAAALVVGGLAAAWVVRARRRRAPAADAGCAPPAPLPVDAPRRRPRPVPPGPARQ